MAHFNKTEIADAQEALRKLLPPGATVLTIVKHVARSGMSRQLSCYVIVNGEPRWLDRLIAKAADYGYDEKREALRVSGCGMDMGFSVVYDVSRILYADGFGCIGEGCGSNDHSNGDRDYRRHESHVMSPDHICATSPETCTAYRHWHTDGGYALRQRWL